MRKKRKTKTNKIGTQKQKQNSKNRKKEKRKKKRKEKKRKRKKRNIFYCVHSRHGLGLQTHYIPVVDSHWISNGLCHIRIRRERS